MLILSALLIYSFSSTQFQSVSVLPHDQISSEVETLKDLLVDENFDKDYLSNGESSQIPSVQSSSTFRFTSLAHGTSGLALRKIPFHLLDLPPPMDA